MNNCAGYNTVTSVKMINNADSIDYITIQDVKNFCRIDTTGEDGFIPMIIDAARVQCEGYVNASFILKTITAVVDNVNGNNPLPYAPVNEIVSFKDEDDNDVSYKSLFGVIKCGSGIVTYKAGYKAAEDEESEDDDDIEILPDYFKTAWLMQINHLYTHRGEEGQNGLSNEVKTMLKPYRSV